MSGWANSNRRDELPRDWHRRRAVVLRRDPVCTCPGCRRHPSLCTSRSTDVDHIGDRHDHGEHNLRGLCSDCHLQHTAAQSLAARGYGPLRLRQAERHPGMVTDSGVGGDSL